MFQSLAQMDELIALGVPSLALSLLDSEQKNYQQFTPDWYGFEYKHILLMAELDQWQDPMRNWLWGERPWRKARELIYIPNPDDTGNPHGARGGKNKEDVISNQ